MASSGGKVTRSLQRWARREVRTQSCQPDLGTGAKTSTRRTRSSSVRLSARPTKTIRRELKRQSSQPSSPIRSARVPSSGRICRHRLYPSAEHGQQFQRSLRKQRKDLHERWLGHGRSHGQTFEEEQVTRDVQTGAMHFNTTQRPL